MKKEEIYKRARKKWGILQSVMVFEEMSELMKELSKYMRGKKDLQKMEVIL